MYLFKNVKTASLYINTVNSELISSLNIHPSSGSDHFVSRFDGTLFVVPLIFFKHTSLVWRPRRLFFVINRIYIHGLRMNSLWRFFFAFFFYYFSVVIWNFNSRILSATVMVIEQRGWHVERKILEMCVATFPLIRFGCFEFIYISN